MSATRTNDDSTSLPSALTRRLVGGDLGPLVALLLIVIFFTIADNMSADGGAFASVRNLRVLLAQTSYIAVAALGMTLVIISGGIDLSAGTALALCATVLAACVKNEWGIGAAVLATLATGCLCGFLNGALVSLLRVVPFIVTLGTMTVFLGIASIIANETTVYPPQSQMPDWFRNLSSSMPPDLVYGFLPNIPSGVWYALLMALAVSALLRYTVFGRYIFALGSNENTARLCGINIPLVKTAVYTLAGLFTALAGIYYLTIVTAADPEQGQGIELRIIAAVVIGGGSLSGGRGSVLGTMTGAAIMAVIKSGCDQLEIRNPYQHIIIGVIIIAAVTLDQFRQRRLAG